MLNERYDIGDMVGEGSFGSVFVASSKESGEKVMMLVGIFDMKYNVFGFTRNLIHLFDIASAQAFEGYLYI
jgi:hypothetical protein